MVDSGRSKVDAGLMKPEERAVVVDLSQTPEAVFADDLDGIRLLLLADDLAAGRSLSQTDQSP
ncbi:hypothetical protein HQQ80_18920 [Microbacteriaceae bacterium VKM Ac-2855]|nr:hypothetical protein [Microbacteriaceae bacterium VKM Ac-2855]